jgi:hypothetical protein
MAIVEETTFTELYVKFVARFVQRIATRHPYPKEMHYVFFSVDFSSVFLRGLNNALNRL